MVHNGQGVLDAKDKAEDLREVGKPVASLLDYVEGGGEEGMDMSVVGG